MGKKGLPRRVSDTWGLGMKRRQDNLITKILPYMAFTLRQKNGATRMSEAGLKREALVAIRNLLSNHRRDQALTIASLFKANEKTSSIDDLTFYAKVLAEVGDLDEASRFLNAALNKAQPNAVTHALETLFWQLRTREDLRQLPRGAAALSHVISIPAIKTVLDVGSGGGEHALEFASSGRSVHCIDYGTSVYVRNSGVVSSVESDDRIRTTTGDFMQIEPEETYDLVWCSHILEHQLNPNLFLKKCLSHVSDGGWISVTVPPLKHQIVGGHVSLWNAGVLLYHLIMAGNNCSQALVMNYDYNISVVVRKALIDLPSLDYDSGDIGRLAQFFPPECPEGFDGRMLGHAIRHHQW